MIWSSTCARADLARSIAGMGAGGLVLGRMNARSRSLSRKTTSAGISVPSSSRILTSLNSVSILNGTPLSPSSPDIPAMMLWIMSPGSQAERASTVSPEASTTVPVRSCLDSLDWPPMPGTENFVLITICTVTMARWLFLKTSRPFSAKSSARPGAARDASNTTRATLVRFGSRRIDVLLVRRLLFPVRLEFQIHRVNAAHHLHHDDALFALRDLLHFPPESVRVFHGLPVHLHDQIVHVERSKLGPTARFNVLDERAALLGAPLLLGGVEKRHITRGELEIVIAIFLHLARQTRRANQFDGNFSFGFVAKNPEFDTFADFVLADQRRKFVLVFRPGGGQLFVVHGKDEVARFQPRFFGGAVRINARDVTTFQRRLPKLPGNLPADHVRFHGQPGFGHFQTGVFQFLDAHLDHRKVKRGLARKGDDRGHRISFAVGQLAGEVDQILNA